MSPTRQDPSLLDDAWRPRKPLWRALTGEQVIAWARAANRRGRLLDLSGFDLEGVDLAETMLRDVVFGWHRGPRPPASLRGAQFRGSVLTRCFFAHTDLARADFRNCKASNCDFRYATFEDTTLQEATLVMCDLYRATLKEGTVMHDTTLELVSLTGVLEGATGLRWSAFDPKGRRRPALVLESERDYVEFLQRTQRDRPEHYPIEDALRDRLDDAARNYRDLCGLWTARGQFRDAGNAYVHGRRLERQAAGPLFRRTPFHPLRWAGLWVADLLCSFGESLWKILVWLVVIALLPGVVYAIAGDVVTGAHGLGDDLLFSASQITVATPTRLSSSSHVVEWVRVVQTLLGVAALGLLGFVLGNKLRSS